MEKIKRILNNTTWHTQLLYGLILAVFFGGATLLSGFHLVFALLQILAVALLRDYFWEDNYPSNLSKCRSFFLLPFPGLIIYILLTL